MIESYYWREELRRDLRWLVQHRAYKRWSEKQMVLFERRLILVAFQIRTLVEQNRVRSTVANRQLSCTWYRKVGAGPVTRLNSHRFERHFDLDNPEVITLKAWDLCNQLIHHYEMAALSSQRSFSELVVFSDRAKNKGMYHIDIAELLTYLYRFGQDDSAVSKSTSTWNPKRQDYDVWVD